MEEKYITTAAWKIFIFFFGTFRDQIDSSTSQPYRRIYSLISHYIYTYNKWGEIKIIIENTRDSLCMYMILNLVLVYLFFQKI